MYHRLEAGFASKRQRRLRAAVGCLACLLAACSAAAGEQLPAPRQIEDADDLLRALQEAGSDPAQTQGALQRAFGGSGSVLRVGAAEIQVYEFSSQKQREALSSQISADGRQLAGRPLAWQGEPTLWAAGRLLVAYVGTDGGTILLLNGLLGDPLTLSEGGVGEPYPPAVPAAMLALATELGRTPQEIDVVRYEQVDWPDACLGLPSEGESCAQALTPGWRVVLRWEAVTYELHTDELGTQVRRR